MLLGTFIKCIRALKFKSQIHAWFQLPANMHPEAQQRMAQVVVCLPSKRKALTELPAPGFYLAQPQQL